MLPIIYGQPRATFFQGFIKKNTHGTNKMALSHHHRINHFDGVCVGAEGSNF